MGEIQQMNKRFLVIPLAAAAAAAIAFVASNSGADFSGTSKTGTITGNAATVAVLGSNGNGSSAMDLQFANLVPGEPQSVSSYFTNTGSVAEDVYVVFNALPGYALHAFDQQGRYASASISVKGGPAIWHSDNINDGLQMNNGNPPAGPYDCSGQPAPQAVCPLPGALLVATNLAPQAYEYWTFTYQLTGSAQDPVHTLGNSSQGAAFNPYPVGSDGEFDAGTNSNGLPYQFYAVPTGQTGPSAALSGAHN